MSINTAKEFIEMVDRSRLRSMQIIHCGLAMGLIVFIGVVVLFYWFIQQRPPVVTTENLQQVQLLSLVNLFFLFSSYSCAVIIPKFKFNRDRLTEILQAGNPADAFCAQFLPARLIQLAIIEAPALFGLVIALLATNNGVLYRHPIYWANLAPSAIMLVFLMLTFPDMAKLAWHFQNKKEQANLLALTTPG